MTSIKTKALIALSASCRDDSWTLWQFQHQ